MIRITAAAVVALTATSVLASAGGASGHAGRAIETATADDVTLTFDWPLDCPVAVTQTYVDAQLTIDVAYEAMAEARDGVVVIEFSDAVVTATDGVGGDRDAELAAFFTNPTIEVEPDGSPVEAVGFEEWLEDFEASGAEGGEAQLEQEVVHRTSTVVWGTWAGLWAELGSVAGAVMYEDIPFLDEGLDEQVADLDVVADVDDAGEVSLVAERWVDGRTATITATGEPATLVLTAAGYEVTNGDDLVLAYEWAFDWPGDCDGPTVAEEATTAATVAEEATTATVGNSGGGNSGDDTNDDGDVVVPPGFDTVTYDELPPEALDTLALIESDGPFPYDRDGVVFENREGILPDQYEGYYHEYTVETPGSDDRGARRIITGEGGEVFYTEDHYDSFQVVIP